MVAAGLAAVGSAAADWAGAGSAAVDWAAADWAAADWAVAAGSAAAAMTRRCSAWLFRSPTESLPRHRTRRLKRSAKHTLAARHQGSCWRLTLCMSLCQKSTWIRPASAERSAGMTSGTSKLIWQDRPGRRHRIWRRSRSGTAAACLRCRSTPRCAAKRPKPRPSSCSRKCTWSQPKVAPHNCLASQSTGTRCPAEACRWAPAALCTPTSCWRWTSHTGSRTLTPCRCHTTSGRARSSWRFHLQRNHRTG